MAKPDSTNWNNNKTNTKTCYTKMKHLVVIYPLSVKIKDNEETASTCSNVSRESRYQNIAPTSSYESFTCRAAIAQLPVKTILKKVPDRDPTPPICQPCTPDTASSYESFTCRAAKAQLPVKTILKKVPEREPTPPICKLCTPNTASLKEYIEYLLKPREDKPSALPSLNYQPVSRPVTLYFGFKPTKSKKCKKPDAKKEPTITKVSSVPSAKSVESNENKINNKVSPMLSAKSVESNKNKINKSVNTSKGSKNPSTTQEVPIQKNVTVSKENVRTQMEAKFKEEQQKRENIYKNPPPNYLPNRKPAKDKERIEMLLKQREEENKVCLKVRLGTWVPAERPVPPLHSCRPCPNAELCKTGFEDTSFKYPDIQEKYKNPKSPEDKQLLKEEIKKRRKEHIEYLLKHREDKPSALPWQMESKPTQTYEPVSRLVPPVHSCLEPTKSKDEKKPDGKKEPKMTKVSPVPSKNCFCDDDWNKRLGDIYCPKRMASKQEAILRQKQRVDAILKQRDEERVVKIKSHNPEELKKRFESLQTEKRKKEKEAALKRQREKVANLLKERKENKFSDAKDARPIPANTKKKK